MALNRFCLDPGMGEHGVPNAGAEVLSETSYSTPFGWRRSRLPSSLGESSQRFGAH
jgi:hypothetical protein